MIESELMRLRLLSGKTKVIEVFPCTPDTELNIAEGLINDLRSATQKMRFFSAVGYEGSESLLSMLQTATAQAEALTKKVRLKVIRNKAKRVSR